MYVVTGGAGFIGSHLVRALNARGTTDVLVVDHLRRGAKFENLRDCQIADYMDRSELLRAVEEERLPPPQAILHQGACTDTMETDGRYLMENNFTFSKALFRFAVQHRVPFVYASSASVYGCNRTFGETPGNERPLNAYGYSKLVFDQFVRRRLSDVQSTVVGLRYFNVYGPRERHKQRMASMVFQIYRQLCETGTARLFAGTDGYGDGEQRRDFVFVEDAVKVNLHFAEAAEPQRGIFNVGTGTSWSFNDVAQLMIERLGTGRIQYIPFDEDLRGRYQSFTQADLTALRAAGYEGSFTGLEEGLAASVAAWREAEAASED